MLCVPDVVQARARPDPNPNPQERPNGEGENYTDYTEYGEEVYGECCLFCQLGNVLCFQGGVGSSTGWQQPPRKSVTLICTQHCTLA